MCPLSIHLHHYIVAEVVFVVEQDFVVGWLEMAMSSMVFGFHYYFLIRSLTERSGYHQGPSDISFS